MEGLNINREGRKLDHIKYSLKLKDGPGKAGFEDITLLHCALPDLNLSDINIELEFLDKPLKAPLIINAITGGSSEVEQINAALAKVAKETGIAMAVGSQTAALENKVLEETFKVVRKHNPEGLIFANVGANTKPSKAIEAVKMLEANALQVHLNVPQELIMPEGDRGFSGYLENLQEIAEAITVPLIVKEVGFGFSNEVAKKIHRVGIKHIDIGGLGGTNFIAIENERRGNAQKCNGNEAKLLNQWGIPTVITLIETTVDLKWDTVIATGGIRNALHCAKALALGANLVGVAGSFLKTLMDESESNLVNEIELFKEELKIILLLTGSSNLREIMNAPLVISGFVHHWLKERGINTSKFAQRRLQI